MRATDKQLIVIIRITFVKVNLSSVELMCVRMTVRSIKVFVGYWSLQGRTLVRSSCEKMESSRSALFRINLSHL